MLHVCVSLVGGLQDASCMLDVARCKPSTALSGDGMSLASIESWRGVRILALVLCGHAGVTRARIDRRNGFGATHFTVDLHGNLSHMRKQNKSEATCFGKHRPRSTRPDTGESNQTEEFVDAAGWLRALTGFKSAASATLFARSNVARCLCSHFLLRREGRSKGTSTSGPESLCGSASRTCADADCVERT
jgi:hypothetical protein